MKKSKLSFESLESQSLSRNEILQLKGGKFANILKWIGAAAAIVGVAIGSTFLFAAGVLGTVIAYGLGADGISAWVNGVEILQAN